MSFNESFIVHSKTLSPLDQRRWLWRCSWHCICSFQQRTPDGCEEVNLQSRDGCPEVGLQNLQSQDGFPESRGWRRPAASRPLPGERFNHHSYFTRLLCINIHQPPGGRRRRRRTAQMMKRMMSPTSWLLEPHQCRMRASWFVEHHFDSFALTNFFQGSSAASEAGGGR